MTYKVGPVVVIKRAFAILLFGGFLAFFQFQAIAQSGTQSVDLAWDASPDLTAVGYKIYYGPATGVYTNLVDVGAATLGTVTGLVAGTTYYFVVTAYNASGIESLPSNEVSFTVPLPAGNQPPTLNVLSNVTINEDAGQQTVNLSGITSGATNESQTLTVTAASSNTGLIPTPSITYTSPNTTGSLRFTPAANAFGTATITVTVNDGGASNNVFSRTFTVTVNAVNDTPTLNALSNLTVNRDAGQQTVTLSGIGSGAANESQTLTVTGSSSNTGLVPTPNITYTTPNTTGSLRFTPAAGATGTATITVTVNDGQAANNTISRTFSVTVNAPPTISGLADRTMYGNTNSGAIPFTVGDAETAPNTLTLSAASSNPALILPANIAFGGSGANRTMMLTPVFGQIGTANITITVNDGNATASSTFQLTVQSPPPAPPANLIIVTTSGAGAVSPNMNGKAMKSGQKYSLTAEPDDEQVFAGWTGSIVSSDPKIIFYGDSNVVVQANFIPSPFIPVRGTYNGLFYESDEVRLPSSGYFKMSLNKKGRYSGRLQIGSRRYPFKGRLDLALQATNLIIRNGDTPLLLTFAVGESGNQVSGQLTDGIWTADLLGDRAAFASKTNPAPYAGRYTILIPGDGGDATVPTGHSYGLVRVDSRGRVRFAGEFADGSKGSQSAYLSQEGAWPLYVKMYAGQGSVMSWLTFTNRATDDLHGTLNWLKLTNLSARLYPAGFTNDYEAVGSLFTPPVDAAVMGLTNAQLAFTGGDLGLGFTNLLALNVKSKASNLSSNDLVVHFSTSSGRFKGKVWDPLTGEKRSFRGAVLPGHNAGYGYLLGTNESSQVLLTP